MTAALTRLLAKPEVRAALREMIAAGVPVETQVEMLAQRAEPGTASGALRELRELPRVAASMILQAWQLADGADKRFEVVSTAPGAPLDFARHKRFRIVVDSESDAVRVGLSHVPGRHAAWYAPAV